MRYGQPARFLSRASFWCANPTRQRCCAVISRTRCHRARLKSWSKAVGPMRLRDFFVRRPDVVGHRNIILGPFACHARYAAGRYATWPSRCCAHWRCGRAGAHGVGCVYYAADRFVARPLSAKSLRFAVGQCLEMVATSRNIATPSASRRAVVPIAAAGIRLTRLAINPTTTVMHHTLASRLARRPQRRRPLRRRFRHWVGGNQAPLPRWVRAHTSGGCQAAAAAAATVAREPTLVLASEVAAGMSDAPHGGGAADDDADTGAGSLALAERSGEPGDSWHISPVRPVTEVVPAASWTLRTPPMCRHRVEAAAVISHVSCAKK